MLPASVQVCPVELPGRGRREGEPAVNDVRELARLLARSLPLTDKPYAIFGTCLGAIVGYEVVREIERTNCAPLPLVFMPAAVSPPHLYALVVMKIYLTRKLGEYHVTVGRSTGAKTINTDSWILSMLRALFGAGRNESPPLEEVMRILQGWKDLPKEKLLKAFEAGHFAGVEEMKRNERLFERVAPMGVNDIMMAVQYR